jgi:hypothetical protein
VRYDAIDPREPGVGDEVLVEPRTSEQSIEGSPVGGIVEYLTQDVRTAGSQERLAEAEDRALRSLHVDLHHHTGRFRDQGGDGIRRSEVDFLASVEPHPRRVEGRERRAPFAGRNAHRLVRIPMPSRWTATRSSTPFRRAFASNASATAGTISNAWTSTCGA